MARDEGFLRRWARRKQATKADETAAFRAPDPVSPSAVREPGEPDRVPDIAAQDIAARDIANQDAAPDAVPALDLPALESLTASSDFAAFLQEGVSAELQSRALRVAWESDESIAGFRGMAEYAWDFNAPDYGKLWAIDDVAKLVREALQGAMTPRDDEAPAPEATPPRVTPPRVTPPEERPVAIAGAAVDPVPAVTGDSVEQEVVAALPEAEPAAPEGVEPESVPRSVSLRRHGSALPG